MGQVHGEHPWVDVYIVQSTNPPAENLLELLIMIDAARRASARKVNAVIPISATEAGPEGPAPRVDHCEARGEPLTQAGADRVITMSSRAADTGVFSISPSNHLYSSAILVKHSRRCAWRTWPWRRRRGGNKDARAYAKRLEADLIVIDKRRPRPERGRRLMNIHRRGAREKTY